MIFLISGALFFFVLAGGFHDIIRDPSRTGNKRYDNLFIEI